MIYLSSTPKEKLINSWTVVEIREYNGSSHNDGWTSDIYHSALKYTKLEKYCMTWVTVFIFFQ